jgi:hydrogenase maturation protein HypF
MIERGVHSPVATSAGRIFDAVAALAGLRQIASFEGQAAMELEFAADTGTENAYPLPVVDTGTEGPLPGSEAGFSSKLAHRGPSTALAGEALPATPHDPRDAGNASSRVAGQAASRSPDRVGSSAGHAAGAWHDVSAPPAAYPRLVLDWRPTIAAIVEDLRRGASAGVISARFHNALALAILAVARRIGQPRVALSGGCFQNRRLSETAAALLEAAGFEVLLHRHVPPNDGGISLGQIAVAAALLGADSRP